MCRIVRGSRARYDRHRHGPLRHAGDSNGCDHGVSVRCARRADGTAGVDRGVGEADEEWRARGCGGFGAGGGAVPGGDQDGGEVREAKGSCFRRTIWRASADQYLRLGRVSRRSCLSSLSANGSWGRRSRSSLTSRRPPRRRLTMCCWAQRRYGVPKSLLRAVTASRLAPRSLRLLFDAKCFSVVLGSVSPPTS